MNADESEGNRANRRENTQQGKRTRSSNLADDTVSPLTRRSKEEKSGGATSAQDSNAWDRSDRQSS